MADYNFIECHIAKSNIGEHDSDNRFLLEGIDKQIDSWQEEHPGCTLVGVCYEYPHPSCKGYYPIVYEDENGNRFWTHWCVDNYKEFCAVNRVGEL